ncbi:MAG TPA: lysophospholipid acyltransferase family protein [Longimicrobiales bacterium]|nr:lysophospholipid acyltransferase family protein [Longimicrobiales bacterium]
MMRDLKFALAGNVGGLTLDALFRTVRYRVLTSEPYKTQRVVYTLWHGRLLPLVYYHRHQGIMTIISQSADGEYIARVVSRWGYQAARGSSSRGGQEALRQMVAAANDGRSIAITPDGPRGPAQKIKLGVLTASQQTGLPILPMACAATHGWWFESWDRFLVPKPFSTVFVRYGEPILIPRDCDADELLAYEQRVNSALNEVTESVDRDAQR